MRFVIPILVMMVLVSCSRNRVVSTERTIEIRDTMILIETKMVDSLIYINDTIDQVDTFYIEKENLRIKVIHRPGETIYVEGKVLSDTIYVEKIKEVIKEKLVVSGKVKRTFWDYFNRILVYLVIGLVGGIAIKYLIKRFL